MADFAYQTRTKILDPVTVATLEDALWETDIPQGYRNALLCQLGLSMAREPGLEIQGQALGIPGGSARPQILRRSGTRAEVFLNFESTTNAQAFDGLDVLSTDINEGPTVTFVDWAFYTVYYAISFTDDVRNSGPMKRLDLLRARQNQEIRGLTRLMEGHMFGTNGDTVATTQKQFAGLGHKIIADPTSATTVQGLPQGTYTDWRNNTNASVGSFAANGMDEFREMIFSCAGTNAHEKPHLIITTSAIAGFLTKALEGVHRVVGSLNGSDLSAARLPSFMDVPIVHSDDQTSGVAQFLNMDYFKSLVHSEAAWGEIIPGEPNDQAVRGQRRKVLGAAPWLCTRREKQGYLGGITA